MEEPAKPTGAHYALVVFVLISIINGMGWLLAYKGADSIPELRQQVSDLRRQLEAAKQKEAPAIKMEEGSSKVDGKN